MDNRKAKGKRDSSLVVCNPRTMNKKLNETRPWPNLPPDVMKSIVARIDGLPWVINYRVDPSPVLSGPDVCVFQMFDPVLRRLVKAELGRNEGTSLFGRNVFALAKKGWLFCTPYKAFSTSFWLFSPFTKQIVTLPDLKVPTADCFTYTFSSDPLSPDCVYFVVRRFHDTNLIMVSTIHQGDREWTTVEFTDVLGRDPIDDVVYHQGCFYCVFVNGEVRVYNVARKSWTNCPRLDSDLTGFGSNFHILVCGGELLVAQVLDHYCISDPKKAKCRVFGFCRSQRKWVAKTSIGDHAVFLGLSSFSITVSRKARDLASRVYYWRRGSTGGPIWFTLGDGKCHGPGGS